MAQIESMWVCLQAGGRPQPIHARATMPPAPLGPPVVVVHGLVVSSRYAEPLLSELGSLFALYAPDLPGFGRSRGAGRADSLGDLASQLCAWLDAAGLDEVSLVANSFGCQVAVELARRHPRRVRRLVLQGATGRPGAAAVGQTFRFLRDATREPPSLAGIILGDFARAGPRRSLTTFRIALREPILDRAATLTHPALVIGSERDAIADPAWTEELAAAMPRATHLRLASAPHAAIYSRAGALADAIAPFLAEDARGAQGARGGAARLGPPRPLSTPRPLARRDPALRSLRVCSAALAGENYSDRGAVPRRPQARGGDRGSAARPASRGRSRGVAPRGESLAAYALSQYPARPYPAFVFGAGCAAVAYAAYALGAPWLPHSFAGPRIRPNNGAGAGPSRRGGALGPSAGEFELGEPGVVLRRVAGAPDQCGRVRINFTEVPGAYVRALYERLSPGATVVLLDSALRWPSIPLAGRSAIQIGGPTDEPLLGSRSRRRPRSGTGAPGGARAVEQVGRVRWEPEAAWALEPSFAAGLSSLASELGASVIWIRASQPEALSSLAAEVYSRWYAGEGRPALRLLAELDALAMPHWAERSATLPFPVSRISSRTAADFRRWAGARGWLDVGAIASDAERARGFRRALSGVPLTSIPVDGAAGTERELRARRRFGREVGAPLPRLAAGRFAEIAREVGAACGLSVDVIEPRARAPRPAS